MGFVSKGLLEIVDSRRGKGDEIGLLIIDEQNAAPANKAASQDRVLQYAIQQDLQVIVAEYYMHGATRDGIAAHLPANTITITKHNANAFIDTQLQMTLQNNHLDGLIVMGTAADCCVKQTILGGWGAAGALVPTATEGILKYEQDFATFHEYEGAAGEGYGVYTCREIIRDGASEWYTDPRIYFCANV